MHSYLTNGKQRTKTFSISSSFEEILFRVLQGSILEPLLFNTFLCDNIEDVIKSLENDSMKLLKWFADNQPTWQIYVCGIFVEYSHDIFPRYSGKVPYGITGNIPK